MPFFMQKILFWTVKKIKYRIVGTMAGAWIKQARRLRRRVQAPATQQTQPNKITAQGETKRRAEKGVRR